jgi:ADP-ribose pyrophosphatase YjhB (NUDIX family)
MEDISGEVAATFGNRVRVRVCGICIWEDTILLVNHKGLGTADNFWSPPGGGLQLGESSAQTLAREFREETGLLVEPGKFLFVNEFIGLPLHAIELFFEVRIIGGTLATGTDPEVKEQIIKEVKFMPFDEILQKPHFQVHALFRYCRNTEELRNLNGYLYDGMPPAR